MPKETKTEYIDEQVFKNHQYSAAEYITVTTVHNIHLLSVIQLGNSQVANIFVPIKVNKK